MYKRLGWTLRMSAAMGGVWVLAGCGAYSVTSTGGAVYQSATVLDPSSSALEASATRDLPCDGADLDIQRLDAERQYAVTGCGWRVLYRVLTPSLTSRRVELVSRAPAAGDVASSPAATVRRPHA